jgi:hypothetical protein
VKKSYEYVFLSLKEPRLMVPAPGVVVHARNFVPDHHLFRVIEKCGSHVIVQNTDPFQELFSDPTIVTLEEFDVRVAPESFVAVWLREMDKLKRKHAREARKAARKAPKLNLLELSGDQHPLLKHLLGGNSPQAPENPSTTPPPSASS